MYPLYKSTAKWVPANGDLWWTWYFIFSIFFKIYLEVYVLYTNVDKYVIVAIANLYYYFTVLTTLTFTGLETKHYDPPNFV